MTYKSTKKIFPGNYAEPLNGWYRNVNTGAGTIQGKTGSNAGPTAVLACPGWRYFQFMGYVPISVTSGGDTATAFQVIIPSPYKNDPTRPNITGMVVSGDTQTSANALASAGPTRGPIYIYRAAISVPSGWDQTIASGVFTAEDSSAITFGLANGGSASTLGTPTNSGGTLAANKDTPASQANIQTTDGFFPAGSQGLSIAPITTSTGTVALNEVYKQVTDSRTFQVFNRKNLTATTTTGGLFISDADEAAGKTGYIFVELDFIQQDNAPEYTDLDGYLPYPAEPKAFQNYGG